MNQTRKPPYLPSRYTIVASFFFSFPSYPIMIFFSLLSYLSYIWYVENYRNGLEGHGPWMFDMSRIFPPVPAWFLI